MVVVDNGIEPMLLRRDNDDCDLTLLLSVVGVVVDLRLSDMVLVVLLDARFSVLLVCDCGEVNVAVVE